MANHCSNVDDWALKYTKKWSAVTVVQVATTEESTCNNKTHYLFMFSFLKNVLYSWNSYYVHI